MGKEERGDMEMEEDEEVDEPGWDGGGRGGGESAFLMGSDISVKRSMPSTGGPVTHRTPSPHPPNLSRESGGSVVRWKRAMADDNSG
jgi:hypothetical protein